MNSTPTTISENKVRLVALWVLLLVSFSYWMLTLPIIIFLSIDFFMRSFGYGKYSLLAILGDFVIKLFHIATKPIYFPPKRFAARIGFVLSLIILAGLLLQLNTVVTGAIVVFAFFAFLESFLGFCAGCYVYSFLIRIKLIR
jgi:hypothetical protein